MRFLLSVVICPVFEKTLSEGTDVVTMQTPCHDFSKPWVDKAMTGRLQWPHPFPLRVLSKTGQIITERRNRISPSKVRQLAFLNANLS